MRRRLLWIDARDSGDIAAWPLLAREELQRAWIGDDGEDDRHCLCRIGCGPRGRSAECQRLGLAGGQAYLSEAGSNTISLPSM